MIDLRKNYQEKVIPNMQKDFGYKNKMAVPKLEKVVVNVGFGNKIAGTSSSEREKVASHISKVLAQITGQKPIITKARKSISSFSLRKGAVAGAKVTIRGNRMYDFLTRLITIVLPRTRDFRGISLDSVDENGNLNIGFRDYSAFPEATLESSKQSFGLEVTVVTNARTKDEGISLLRLLGFPFERK